MILGLDRHPAARCFEELDEAVAQMTDRLVCFNAHMYDAPPGAILFNTEDVDIPANGATVVSSHDTRWRGREVWDCGSAANAKKLGATYVPIGYHPSMTRFAPAAVQDIDVLLYGCMSERRRLLLDELAGRGLNVVHLAGSWGAERDAVIARAKVVLNVSFNADGAWPTHRAAHLVANSIFVLSEAMPDAWPFVFSCPYERLVDMAEAWAGVAPEIRAASAKAALDVFKQTPLTLPEPKREHDVASYGAPLPADPWAMLHRPPATWDVGAMYDAQRGAPVSATPMVQMVVPSYREGIDIQQKTEPARAAIQADLAAHGIDSCRASVHGDSLVARMRQRAVNQFLKSSATHLLWCDLDIEPLDPTCARRMLATGYDVIAGACPFKSFDRRVVCNLLPGAAEAMEAAGKLDAPKGCLEVQDAGTGFMLVSRKAIVALMEAHPELLHWSRGKADVGEPLWAIYDTGVIDGVYQSEDYMFCHLWRQMGGKVYVHLPSTFRHYGTHGFEGSILEQLGLAPTP